VIAFAPIVVRSREARLGGPFGPIPEALVLSLVLASSGCNEATGPEREISGQQLYEQYCARCHGTTGRPDPNDTTMKVMPRDLSDRRIVDNLSDESIKGIVRAGSPNMPAFRDQFTDGALLVMVAYVRSLSGSEGKRGKPTDEAP
jgi:mono/diheme cytochrome c family protein